ncbi:SLBB domain-containing protein [Thermovibrio sp.]
MLWNNSLEERKINIYQRNLPNNANLPFTGEGEYLKKTEAKILSPIEKDFFKRGKSFGLTLRQFGYNFFSQRLGNLISVPVSSSYTLGPGDELLLYVIGAPPDLNLPPVIKLTVDQEGKVYIPDFGVFYVWGMSLKEAQELISKSLGLNVKLTVGKLRTFPVYVSGEVKHPGAVIVTGVNTVIDALIMAGGIQKTGTLRDIVITRKTPKGLKRIHLDFYKLLIEGKPVNLQLLDGDVIFVGPIGKVAGIGGQVKIPAIYEIKGTETLNDLIKMAGGVLPSSYKYRVIVQRYKNHKFLQVIQGSLNDKDFMSQKVQDGDLVIIRPILDIPENAVMVDGYAAYPGIYEYRKGMKLSDLLKKDMFLPNSNMYFGLIERRYPLGSTPKYITFSPIDVLSGKQDLELKPKDRIVLYKFGDIKSVDFNKVKDAFLVEGTIKYPGVYAYKKGEKLSDILTSDMIVKNTNLYYAEIERRNPETFELERVIKFAPIDVLNGKEDIEIHKLDTIRFFPKFVYPPIEVTGLIKKSYYLPYHQGMKLSEALSQAKFLDDVKELKAFIFRKLSYGQFQDQNQKIVSKNQTALEGRSYERLFPGSYNQIQKGSPAINNQIVNEIAVADNSTESFYKLFRSSISNNGTLEGYLGESTLSVYLYDLLIKRKPEADIPLFPGDRIVIQKVRPDEIVEKVTVSGYVKRPGIYKIDEGTTLYDVLKRAQGFRRNAYPQGIIILRESVKEMQKKRLMKAISLMKQELEKEEAGIMQSDLTPEEVKARQAAFEAKRRLLSEMEKAQVTGRISGIVVPFDLEKLKNSPYNIVLQDGDRIYIPKRPTSVLVFGEVYNPSALVYRKGMTVEDYILKAGGLTKDADKDNIFVIKADGSVVSSENMGKKEFNWEDESNRIIIGNSDSILSYVLQPGDSIIVPTKIHVPIMWRPLIKDVMQIIYQGAITVYTITKL